MKFSYSLLVAPVIIMLSACSSHYSASSHHGYNNHRHGHVSVGINGHHRGRAGNLLGALVVGGVIGHLLTEASKKENSEVVHSTSSINNDNDELLNGYPLDDELADEQKQWYQLGKDGNCYLMTSINGNADIVSLVPKNMCG